MKHINSIKNKEQLKAIDVLRFPLIVLVIFIHSAAPEIQKVYLGADSKSLYILFSEMISHNLGRIAVPCFFLFSGYFFFLSLSDFSRNNYLNQLKKRVRTLVIPYFLWNTLFIVIILIKNYLFHKIGLSYDEFWIYLNSTSCYEWFWGGPINFPLWYMRDLICMTILAPLFYYLFYYLKTIGLFILVLIYLSCYELGFSGFSMTAIFFFGAGAFFGIYKYNIVDLSQKNGKIIMFFALILFGYVITYNGEDLYEIWIRIFVIFGVSSALFCGYLILKKSFLKSIFTRLAPTVFFIYVIHELYLMNWINGFFIRMTWKSSDKSILISYFIIPIVCLMLSLLLYIIIKRIFPAFLQWSTGNRVTNKPIMKTL